MDAVECNRGAQAAPVPNLLLLLGGLPPGPEDNATFIQRAFTDAGWTVRALHLDTLRLGPMGPLAADRAGTLHALKDADLLWILGFGSRSAFLDKSQILQSLEGSQAFVSQPSALHLYHSKYPFPGTPTPFPHPESYASSDAAWLQGQARGGGRWVLKPPAGSFGAEVSFWDGQDPALGDALARATEKGRYALLQQEIEGSEEWRILVAGERVLGAYERRAWERAGGLEPRRGRHRAPHASAAGPCHPSASAWAPARPSRHRLCRHRCARGHAAGGERHQSRRPGDPRHPWPTGSGGSAGKRRDRRRSAP